MGTRHRRGTRWDVDSAGLKYKGPRVPFFVGFLRHLIVNLLKPFPLPRSLY